MPKSMKAAMLACLLALLPAMGNAQTCKSGSIPATTPTSRFTDHHNGTVTDTQTGLMWKKCSEGQIWDSATNGCGGSSASYTWEAAMERAEEVNAGEAALGHDDWRVPDINALRSIIEKQCTEPAINLAVFPATPSAWFWSSSQYASNRDSAWYVIFYGGYDDWNVKGVLNQVRLVRGKQNAI